MEITISLVLADRSTQDVSWLSLWSRQGRTQRKRPFWWQRQFQW